MSLKSGEILAKLKAMANTAGEKIFERVGLAKQLLGDETWIASECGADPEKALALVEAECFPELATAFGLSRLLVLLEQFPAISDWRQHKFNLTRLWAEHKSKKKKTDADRPKQERRAAKIADIEERDEKIKQLEWTVKNQREAVEAKESELMRLRRENDELRGEIKAINRMLAEMREERRRQLI